MSINVTRSSMPDFEEYCQEIRELWDSRWLTNMGQKHRQLQAALETYLKVPHVSLYTNGHLALEHILAAMDFPRGSEVITTPFTFASTTHAIVRTGLKPVFCDVEPVTYTMDVSKIESLITSKTVAILPVHVYGNLCDVEGIDRIAKKHGLKVIYDAAHAFGVRYRGISSACFGDASMFSFHATKVYNTIEGGALCFADDGLIPVLNNRKNFGLQGDDCIYPGGNAKMNEFQAAMGLCNLRHLTEEIKKRKKVADRYTEELSLLPGITCHIPQPEVESNYAYYPIVVDETLFGATRDEIFAALAEEEITARKYFYPTTNAFSCYRDIADPMDTPVALSLAARVLCLPIYADLAAEDVERIITIIKQTKRSVNG